jgi:hypothetical protein
MVGRECDKRAKTRDEVASAEKAATAAAAI